MTHYVIPSRQRAETLCACTLPELLRLGVQLSDITLFVHPDEHLHYSFSLLEHDYGDVELVPGKYGVAAQRNNILQFCSEGEHIVSVDDDIRSILVRRSDKVLEPVEQWEWEEIVSLGHAQLAAGHKAWGLYPVKNPFFMRPKLRTDLCYIGAGLYGFLSDPDEGSPLRVSMEDKEDFERSIQCYLSGGVSRFEWLTWDTRVYTEPGGMQSDGLRTPERVTRNAEELARRYPLLCSTKSSARGHTELRLKDRRAK